MENQPITDVNIQQDEVWVRGEDGTLHKIEVTEDENN